MDRRIGEIEATLKKYGQEQWKSDSRFYPQTWLTTNQSPAEFQS